ncbi:MAG: serine/threonine-protein kinase [Polyangiaceae bacterium]
MGQVEREPSSGDVVGRYQLVAPIGAGGMGRVWVALDTAAPALRLVALKTGLPGAAENRDFWAVLSDEATLASRIQHGNVCATYEFGTDGELHYLVMEWSDGASLRDLLDAIPGHRIEPALAAHLVAGVAAGLHAAHELTDEEGHLLGVVHRDVSPQNVLISMRGHVCLADFGVAKARGQAHRPTETGEVKGKLSYMAPEQVASKHVDHRADVFALGCVLYEASVGHRPFHGNDALATMYKILEQDVELPSAHDAEFPPDLQAIILKALAKSPADRFQSAADLGQSLSAFIASTRRRVADKHTAELLGSVLGPALRKRNQEIFALGNRLRQGLPSADHRTPMPVAQGAVTPEGGIERSISDFHRARSQSKPPWLYLALAGGLLAALGVFLFSRRMPASNAPSAALSASVVAAVAAPSAMLEVAPPPQPPAIPTASSPELRAPSEAQPTTSAKSHAVAAPRVPVHGAAALPGTATAGKASAHAPRPIDHSNPFLNP